VSDFVDSKTKQVVEGFVSEISHYLEEQNLNVEAVNLHLQQGSVEVMIRMSSGERSGVASRYVALDDIRTDGAPYPEDLAEFFKSRFEYSGDRHFTQKEYVDTDDSVLTPERGTILGGLWVAAGCLLAFLASFGVVQITVWPGVAGLVTGCLLLLWFGVKLWREVAPEEGSDPEEHDD
jgi:hypothetical protein